MKKHGWLIAVTLTLAATAALGIGLRLKSKTMCIQPEEDGGINDNTDHSAPKSIASREITAFYTHFCCEDPDDPSHNGVHRFEIIKNDSGTLMLTASGVIKGSTEVNLSLLEKVQDIIERYDLVKQNGISCITKGLPVQYSPCSLSAEYASGEQLNFTIDGCPDEQWCIDLKNLFLGVL